MLDSSTLAEELIGSLLDSSYRDLIIKVESSHWCVLAWSGCAWEREHDTLWNIIELTIGLEADGLPFVASEDPVTHVVNGGISG